MNGHLRRWRKDQGGFGEAGEKQESCGLGGPLCLQRVCCPELHRDWGPGFWFVHLSEPRSDRIGMGRVGMDVKELTWAYFSVDEGGVQYY